MRYREGSSQGKRIKMKFQTEYRIGSFSDSEWPTARNSTVSLTEHFGNLDDPRIDRTKHDELIDILTIALCGVIAGADSWVDVEAFGRRKEGWLRKMLELPNGIPSHDTFGRVFAELDAEQFKRCFTEWVLAVNEVLQGAVVAKDVKTVRRSHDRRDHGDSLEA